MHEVDIWIREGSKTVKSAVLLVFIGHIQFVLIISGAY